MDYGVTLLYIPFGKTLAAQQNRSFIVSIINFNSDIFINYFEVSKSIKSYDSKWFFFISNLICKI